MSDLDLLPLLPHQVKHLKVDESCSLDAEQTKKVGKAMETQTYLESSAIATMCDLEEGLTKTVTLTPAEAAVITKEQFAKIQVAVSKPVSMTRADEAVTLTPIEIHQMELTDEQKEQIKAKKVKRIEKHGKAVKKLVKQSATLVEMSVERSTSPPVLKLTEEQASQVQGMVAPTRDQQTQMSIEPGRQLDSEELAGVVLTEAQITQLEIGPDTNLDPEQRESVEEAKQRSVKQDALKRLNEIQPLNEVEMILSESQAQKLTSRQIDNLKLTAEQCDILGLVPGQNFTIDEISLLSLNGEQIIQLKLTEEQIGLMNGEQRNCLSALTNRAVQELAYLKMKEEEGVLRLTEDQVAMLSEEQIARLTLNPAQTTTVALRLPGVSATVAATTTTDKKKGENEKKKVKLVRLTAEQASLLTETQLMSLVLTEEQLNALGGISQDEVCDLTPSQLSTIAFTSDQIAALKISQNQVTPVRILNMISFLILCPARRL
eukprot:sb/3464184/